MLDDRKSLERELSDAKKKLAMGGGDASASGDDGCRRTVGGVKAHGAGAWKASTLKDLRSLADEGKKKLGSGIVAIVAVDTGEARPASSSASPPTCRPLQRRRLVRQGVAEALGGKGGGGRPDMAQAGGPDGGAGRGGARRH